MNGNGIVSAERRVREMNRMAQQYVRQGNSFMRQNNQRPRQEQPRFEQVNPVNQPPVKPQSVTDNAPRKTSPLQPTTLQSFGMDNEKLLILLIIYLLIKEKADIKLIAALGYLLL